MASEVDNPSHLLDRTNFKSSLEKFQRLVRLIIAQNNLDRSETNINQEDNINYSQFYNIVISLFGHSLKAQEIKAFYRKITKHPDAPVDWTELFGCFHRHEDIIAAHSDPENTVFFLSKRETIKNASGGGKKMRDTIQCIVKVPLLDAVLTVSQYGTISLFNSQMRQHSCIHATESSWFLGCDFLNQLKRVVAVTERSMVIWDYKCDGKNQENYVCIKPMEHCLLCVCTVISQDQTLQEDILVGDDAGFVSLYSISSADLKIQHSKSNKIFHPVALDSSKFKRFRRKLHHDWIVKIKYFPELKLFASSSPDSNCSLVLADVNRIKDTGSVSVFSVPKGVTTFAYCVKANMIVTGGPDKVIRLWHPTVVKKPMGKLFGHLYSIAAIAVNEKDQHIISLSTARGFRVWDIHTLSLLQVFDAEQGPSDRCINSMIFDNKHLRLITGSCSLDVWPLTRMIQDTRQVPCSHDRPINALGYNKVFNQILSICSGSVLKVWKMETGYQIYEIKDAHGPTIEVTAAAIHNNGFHFATGAYNGSLKIWDFGNGYEIKALPPKKGYRDEDQGFCQLSFLRAIDDQHIIIALDVSGNLKTIQGKEDDPTLFVTMEFNEDIGVWFKTLQPVQNKPVGRIKHLPTIKITFDPKVGGVNKQETTSRRRTIICFDALWMEHHIVIVTGSLCGEINMYKLYASTVQLVCSRNVKDDIMSRTFLGTAKAQRINTVLLLLPANVEDLKILSTNNQFQDISTYKKNVNTSEMSSADKHDKEPYGLRGNNCHSMTLNGKCVTPLTVLGHENGHLYLWNAKGDLIAKVLPYTKHPPIPLTVLCTNKTSNIILAGNKDGYVIIWRFLNCEESHQHGSEILKQHLCWRAHTLKITSLCYEDSTHIVVSASADGSVRLWHASSGHYIGYFGQRRVFELTNKKAFILPCDVIEMPVKTKSETNILGKKNYEYPLIYDCDSFKLTTTIDPLIKGQFPAGSALDIKYFKALSCPKFKRGVLEKSTSEGRETGAVFKTMPIYKLQSIKFPMLPSYEWQSQEHEPKIITIKTKPWWSLCLSSFVLQTSIGALNDLRHRSPRWSGFLQSLHWWKGGSGRDESLQSLGEVKLFQLTGSQPLCSLVTEEPKIYHYSRRGTMLG
ncbi:WD repeat-containing protein 64 [Rhinoderma darwinii]|uniref:WD repeat-containing protein 64 n=1 Tax=Rhinoderma darwinii TaxID=43563 RepID=UPI003F676952